MAEILLIRTGALDAGDAAAFLACDAAGQLLLPPQRGTLRDAAPLAQGGRVVGLVPAQSVLTLDADLPARAGSRLAQAVPFALEEQLADDVDTLHFALGARDESGKTPVAVVARPTLDGWLAAFAAAGIQLDALHCEAALVQGLPGNVVALLDGAEVHLCPPDGRAVTLPASPIADAIELAAGSATGSLVGLLIHATAEDWKARAAEVEALRPRFATLKVQILQQGVLPWLAQNLANCAPINLLQGDYAPRRSGAADWRRWRVAAGLALALLVLHGGARLREVTRLGKQESAVEAQLADPARPVLGASADTADQRRAVERQLLATRSAGAGAGDFLPALAALAAARATVPDARVESVAYQPGSVEVKLQASDAASVERINAALRSGGWQAELQGGSAAGQGYQGRIRITPGAAAGAGS
jgi:general secretion pathway protein L